MLISPWNRLTALIVAAAAVLAGCPRGYEPAAAPAVTSPDPEKQRHFSRAQARFDAGGLKQADTQFKAFIVASGADPLTPLAAVYRGRIALRQGKLPEAQALLVGPASRPAADAVGLQARYYLGLALVRQGDAAGGRRLLMPYLKLVKEDARPALLAALARAAQLLGKRSEALAHLAALHAATTRPAERRFARQGLEALTAQATAVELRRLLDAVDSSSLAAALAGARLAAKAISKGRWTEAQSILASTTAARAAHGVTAAGAASSRRLIGLLVPFSGRYRAVGARVLIGAVEASGVLGRGVKPGQRDGGSQGGAPLELAVRDSSADPAAAARELIDTDKVIALAGTLSPAAAQAVAEVAASRAVPFVTLARVGADKPGDPFSLLPDNAARAAALARHAAGLKLGRIVILRPETRYGRTMARAFTQALPQPPGAGPAVTVVELGYPRRTTSFTALAEKLKAMAFDGIFIPDAARSVGLLAPALARVGRWTSKAAAGRAARAKRRGRGKQHQAFTLLATADGLSSRQLATTSRYLQGAVLAPGYIADGKAPTAGPLVRRYEASQGRAPGLIEALGYDCVRLYAGHLAAGTSGRASLLTALRSGKGVQGLTGRIRFDASGRRADPPLLYRIEGRRARQLPQAQPAPATAARP